MCFFERKGPSGFSKSSTAEEVTQGIDGTGLTAIVTGASSGIGRETTRVLALRGVHVVMAVRNTDSGRKVKEAILEENPNAKIDVKELDLGSLASVRNFASEFKSLGFPLNLLINNAGVFAPPFMLSPDNIDLQFQTNHLGHFLLTNLLLETMKSTALQSHKEGRILTVSSGSHWFAFRGIQFDRINDESRYNRIYGYVQSKLANILHAKELAKRLKEEGVEITANSVHPGCVNTNIMRYISFLDGSSTISSCLVKNTSQGAATTCYVAMHPQVKGLSGEYFADCNIANSSSLAKDAELAKKMWDFSLSLTDAK
ncbi:hypothetical protein RHMOL_Rhmol07G0107800 [Rhododendron molle]|uniref:Uncharacterized protein n=1 Tax=Rhododendron molle TaxID=49168 RepID=A0ACC0MZ33_RHOML|nr:hypothetical protein RHMOL_Rhmol07G0107800 [Rhododendron molle]